MKPEVFTNFKFVLSTPVGSNDENIGLLEAAYRFDSSMVSRIEVKVYDNHGREQEVTVHDWNVDAESMTYFGENE